MGDAPTCPDIYPFDKSLHKPRVKKAADMNLPGHFNWLMGIHFIVVLYLGILAILSALELAQRNVASVNAFLWMWAVLVFIHVAWALVLMAYRYQRHDVQPDHIFDVESPFWVCLLISCLGLAFFWSFQRVHNQNVITNSGAVLNVLNLFKNRALNGPYVGLAAQVIILMLMALSQWNAINAFVVASLVVILFVSGKAILRHAVRLTMPWQYTDPNTSQVETHTFGASVKGGKKRGGQSGYESSAKGYRRRKETRDEFR
mgnify:CR=1 FL=1